MDLFLTGGRVFYALAIFAFGIQHLIYAGLGKGIGPPWFPHGPVSADAVGIVFLVSGALLVVGRRVQAAATACGAVLLLFFLLLHLPQVVGHLRDGGIRTSAFEVLALSGGAFVLAGASKSAGQNAYSSLATVGRFFLAFAMLVFGINHLLYMQFVASLIPFWVPGHVFLTYFTAFGFIAAALAIAVNVWSQLAAALLGLMFFLWVVMLHAPRVAAQAHDGKEWTSLFVALAMCGASFALARPRSLHIHSSC